MTFFFNIERIMFYKIDANIIRSDTYIFVAGVALIALLLPRMNNWLFALFLATATAIFMVEWYNDPVWEKHVTQTFPYRNGTLLLTIIQTNAIILTGLLTRQITYGLSEFETTIANITFNRVGKRPAPFAEEQGVMYNEVRRAARYQRPLSLVAFKVKDDTLAAALPKMVQEVQQAMMKEFTLAGIARILDNTLSGFNTIALKDDCFIVLLPEIKSDEATHLVHQLKKAIYDKLHVELQIGMASFPDEEMTFESLVERAINNAGRQTPEPQILKQKQQAVIQEV